MFILQALFMGMILLGLHGDLCKAFSVTPAFSSPWLLLLVGGWITFMMANPLQGKKGCRNWGNLGIGITIGGAGLWSLLFSDKLIAGVNSLVNFVLLRMDLYYRTNTWGDEDLESGIGTAVVLLMLEVVVVADFAFCCYRWKHFSEGLLPLAAVLGGGLFLGSAPRVRQMILLILGILGSWLCSSMDQSKKERKHQKTEPPKHSVWLVTVAMGVLCLTLFVAEEATLRTEKHILNNGHKYVELQHALEADLEQKVSNLVMLAQMHMGIVHPGVLTNAAPKYRGETVLEVTMQEKPSASIYLRGYTANHYENGKWTDTIGSKLTEDVDRSTRDYLEGNCTYLEKRNGSLKQNMKITYEGRVSKKYLYLPYAASVAQLSKENRVEGVGDLYLKPNQGGDTYLLEAAGVGDSLAESKLYNGELLSRRGSLGRADLEDWERKYCQYVLEQDLQLPEKGLQRTKRLADTIFSSYFQQDGLDTVSNIRYVTGTLNSFFRETTIYSLNLEAKRPGMDYVEDFLFEQGKGYCEHYATAGAVLLRELGIPSRYVSGYHISPDQFTQNEDGTYTAKVPDSSAHAWTEFYSLEAGWTVADFTTTDDEQSWDDADQELQSKAGGPAKAFLEETPEPAPESEQVQSGSMEVTLTPEPTVAAMDDSSAEGDLSGQHETASKTNSEAQTSGKWTQLGKKVGIGLGCLLLLAAVVWLVLMLPVWIWTGRLAQARKKGKKEWIQELDRYLEQFLWIAGCGRVKGHQDQAYFAMLRQVFRLNQQMEEVERYRLLLERIRFGKEDVTEEEVKWFTEQIRTWTAFVMENQYGVRLLIIKKWKRICELH